MSFAHFTAWSTRAKFGLTFGLLALLAFSLAGWLAGRWVERQVMEIQVKRLNEAAVRMATALDVGLFERLREISNLAAEAGASASPYALDRTDLERLKATYPFYVWIGYTDASGTVVAATGGLLEGQDVSGRPWWRSASESPSVGDVHEAQLLKSLLPAGTDEEPLRLMDVSAPVRRNGRLAGVLGAHLSWLWASEVRDRVLAQVSVDESIELFIYDASGRNLRLSTVDSASQPLRLADLLSRAGVSSHRWDDGQTYLSTAVRRAGYRDYAGLGWSVVVRQPLDLTVAPAQRLRNAIWTFGALGASLLALLGWLLTGRLLAPLRQVADVAQAELPADAPRDADEVRRLSSALGNLVARLRSREAELMQLTGTLERRVAERTEALERRNADLRGMARMVSHDVRGPVGSVVQALQLAARAEPARQRHLIEVATRECQHISDVVDALLALSVSESRAIDRVPVDMTSLAAASVERQRALNAYAGTVSLQALPTVEGDEVLLGQVWDNLIGNAMKFSRLGEAPHVVIAGERTGNHWRFRVSDNGVGFDAGAGHRLFTAFERLHRDGRYPGTGLGLSIVERVVQRHGGEVDASGAVGEGARFSFTLPVLSRLD